MPLNIDWQQILLHLLNFVILFTGLWFLLYKPVRSFMQKRKEHYEKMDADAEKKHAEAEEKRAVYEEKLAHAEDEIAEKRRLAEKETAEYDERKRRETDELAKNIVLFFGQLQARLVSYLCIYRNQVTGVEIRFFKKRGRDGNPVKLALFLFFQLYDVLRNIQNHGAGLYVIFVQVDVDHHLSFLAYQSYERIYATGVFE